MSNLRGGIGQSLNRALDTEGGRLNLNQIRDDEGISPVLDIGRFLESELYVQDTRGFDTGALAQSTTDTQTIGDLPPISELLGIFVNTDDATRLASVGIDVNGVGVIGATVRDWPLWLWVNGGDTATAMGVWLIGEANLGTLLIAAEANRWWRYRPVVTNAASLGERQGGAQIRIRVNTTGFGAGTVRVSGHLVLGFYRRDRDLIPIHP